MKRKAENSKRPYSDEDLIVILSDAPTRANVTKHAARFQRTERAIFIVYRRALLPAKTVAKSKWNQNSFANQIRRVKKQLGWIS